MGPGFLNQVPTLGLLVEGLGFKALESFVGLGLKV